MHVLPKCTLTYNGLYGVIVQKRKLHYFVLPAQVSSTVLDVLSFWGFLGLYATLVAIACSQLQKLQTGLKNFRKESLMNPDIVQEELHEYVRFHQNILR
jgi:hypothetical protein